MTADHDAVKAQNDKLRIILKKKQMEITEMVSKNEAELKTVQERVESGAATLNAVEKRDFLDAIELLKSENQSLVAKTGKEGPSPMAQQQVFRSLMRALDRAKQIIQSIEEKGKLEDDTASLLQQQAGQKRQRTE